MTLEPKPTPLPFAQGQEFATLDAYLAHLQQRGAHDVPWYRQIAPGQYELVARGRGKRGTAPVRFTRAELAAKFGFEADDAA